MDAFFCFSHVALSQGQGCSLAEVKDALEFQQKLSAEERWPGGHGGEPLPRLQAGVQLDGVRAPLQVQRAACGKGPEPGQRAPDGELGQALAWRPLV